MRRNIFNKCKWASFFLVIVLLLFVFTGCSSNNNISGSGGNTFSSGNSGSNNDASQTSSSSNISQEEEYEAPQQQDTSSSQKQSNTQKVQVPTSAESIQVEINGEMQTFYLDDALLSEKYILVGYYSVNPRGEKEDELYLKLDKSIEAGKYKYDFPGIKWCVSYNWEAGAANRNTGTLEITSRSNDWLEYSGNFKTILDPYIDKYPEIKINCDNFHFKIDKYVSKDDVQDADCLADLGYAVTPVEWEDIKFYAEKLNTNTGSVAVNNTTTTMETVKKTNDVGYIIADSNRRYVTDSDLDGLSRNDVVLAKNEIYARHGRAFNTQWIREYFEGTSWYEETYSSDYFDSNLASSTLNAYEKTNVQYILDYEKRKGYSK